MSGLKAVFFDQDGVIVDTERLGHRVAFNRAFEEFGLGVSWDEERYHELLQVGGGKERIRHAYELGGFGRDVDDVDALIRDLHRRKTDLFLDMLEAGELPLRPGVHRLMKEINEVGLVLGITTTSNERNAQAIAHGLLGDIRFDFILAGDVVAQKKPDPEIYHRARETAGAAPQQCLVVEDSQIGVTAARAAGMRVLCTVSDYTQSEDTSAADWVVDCLGEPGGPETTMLQGPTSIAADGYVTLECADLAALFCCR